MYVYIYIDLFPSSVHQEILKAIAPSTVNTLRTQICF